MCARDSAFLTAAMNSCYEQGMAALKNNDVHKARWLLYSSAENMLHLAKDTQGKERARLIQRAEELCAFAERAEAYFAAQEPPTEGVPSHISHDQNDTNECRLLPTPAGDITFDSVMGLEDVKNEVRRTLIYPQNYPELYREFGKKPGGGILLYGVPGTGKTMIAHAIANELGAAFYPIKCSDILSKWFGQAEQNIKSLFEQAKKQSKAVIFFDEFDALGSKRDTDSSTMKRVIPELLVHIQDAHEAKNTLLVLAATNRPWDLDSAFLRPGRFDISIHVTLPNVAARRSIIEKHLAGVPCSHDLDLENMVERSQGFSGADMTRLCEKLKELAIERIIGGCETHCITNADAIDAFAQVTCSVDPRDLCGIERYHEQRTGKKSSS